MVAICSAQRVSAQRRGRIPDFGTRPERSYLLLRKNRPRARNGAARPTQLLDDFGHDAGSDRAAALPNANRGPRAMAVGLVRPNSSWTLSPGITISGPSWGLAD